jgi:aldose 1-epimerase
VFSINHLVTDHNGPLTLTAGAARVDLYPEAGGRIGQITIGGRAVLRGPEHAADGWGRWGSFPMLPWTNRIAGGIARFDGATFSLPVNWPDGSAIHGLVAERPWHVVEAGPRHATLSIEVDVDRYHVRSVQTFALTAEAIDLDIELVNLAGWRVPVGIGIHPWFVAKPIRVPADHVWGGSGPLPDGPPRPVRPDEDLRAKRIAPPMDRCFTSLTGSRAEIGDLTLSWRGPITQVVVYRGDPELICVEPCTMANDGIRLAEEGIDGTGVIVLEPGDCVAVGYRFAWPRPG